MDEFLPQLPAPEERPALRVIRKKKKRTNTTTIVLGAMSVLALLMCVLLVVGGGYAYRKLQGNLLSLQQKALPGERIIQQDHVIEKEYIPQTTQEQKIIDAVRGVSPAVVSIIISKNVPIIEQYYSSYEGSPYIQIPQYRQVGTRKQDIGGGSGFIVSEDGLVATNKHVVLDTTASYAVFTKEGKSYPGKVVARDPLQDIAFLKIDQEKVVHEGGSVERVAFPAAKFAEVRPLEPGQTVIAIGNALGEYNNTVSVGVVSGLSRTIVASGGSFQEVIEDVIQTDAAINQGNSGGPLLNLTGEVVGINTATITGAQSIGFAIPANRVARDLEQVQKDGKIIYSFLGVRYQMVTPKVQEQYSLSYNYGAYLVSGDSGPAVSPGSPATTAGLQEEDLILEVNGQKLTSDMPLGKVIQNYDPRQEIALKVLRGGGVKNLTAVLGTLSSDQAN